MKNTITSKTSQVPEDLILEVLRILEAKSLLRLRCVSKSWNSIISDDPSFAASHLKRSRLLLLEGQERQSFRTADYEALRTRSVIEEVSPRRSFPSRLMEACDRSSYGPSWVSSTPNLTICGSCNGICLGVSEHDLHLWNPTTGEVCSLPKPPHRREGWREKFGFGWDASVDDYKVVRVLCGDDSTRTEEVEVLALKSKTWVTKFPSDDDILCSSFDTRNENKIVYCNGAVHWLVMYSRGGRITYHVARFDLAEEKLDKVFIPRSVSPFPGGLLCVLGDRLCFCPFFNANWDPFRCNVWVMEDGGGGGGGLESPWRKLATIEDAILQRYVPLSSTADGGMIGVANGVSLVKHSSTGSGGTTTTAEVMYRDGDDILNHRWLEVALYEETLVSLAAFGDRTTRKGFVADDD